MSKSTDQSGGALILSIVSLGAWIIPLIGIPVSIIAMVMGYKSAEHTKSQIAVGISTLTLVAALVNAFIGAANSGPVSF